MMNPTSSRWLRTVVPVAVIILAAAGCAGSSGGGSSSPPASPSATQSLSPSASAASFTVTVTGWDLVLTPATTAPPDWPMDIPAPEEGVLQASGTGEPAFTSSDHPIVAVQYMAPGEVAQVKSAQAAAMQAQGWKASGKDHGAAVFIKGNESARIAVEPNASTGGVTVYQWT